ncbi:MAG: PilZ domain-containing protein [Leptospiraceae bacterium]
MSGGSFFNESLHFRDPAQQKRKKARAQIQAEAEFALNNSGGFQTCQLVDIGIGGLSFTSRSTLYQGDRLSIRFRLLERQVEFGGEVSRVSGKYVGMAFIEPAEEDLELIQKYIHSNFFDKERKKP